jgi:hypothetical protein
VEARFFAPVQTGLGAHPASCKMGTGSFPGVESGRGVTLTLLVPRFENRVQLYHYSPFVTCKKGETYLPTYLLNGTHPVVLWINRGKIIIQGVS